MLEISNKKSINKISALISAGRQNELSEEDKRLLADIETANKYINSSKYVSKYSIVKAIQENLDCAKNTAYKIFNDAILLYGHLEYPGLPSNKVFALRKMYAYMEETKAKADNDDLKEAFRIEYAKLLLKIQNDINKIEGNYKAEIAGIDYSKWERPKLVVSTNANVLKLQDALLQQIEDVEIEVDEDDLDKSFME